MLKIHRIIFIWIKINGYPWDIHCHIHRTFIGYPVLTGKLKAKKCDFFKTKIDYLGHVVSSEGVAPDDKKVQSILNYSEPRNQKELSSFLGLASYYRKFVRAFAGIAHSLTSLTRKDAEWKWGDEQRDAFNRITRCLTSKPILKYPDFTRDFIVHTDALVTA